MTSGKGVKVALLSSFTFRGVKEALAAKCIELNINMDLYEGGYQQYAQEVLQSDSGMYRFKPDLVFLFIDTLTLLGDMAWLPYDLSDDERQVWVKKKLSEIRVLVGAIKKYSTAKIVVHNFAVQGFSPMGILESKQPFGLIEAVEKLNTSLRKMGKLDDQLFVFDYEAFCARWGKEQIFDSRLYYLGDIRLHPRYVPFLCDEYMAYVKPLVSLWRKCLVVDLDNTLWGGVLGEEGVEGIELGPTPRGRPYWELQKYILSLFKRGVILAINSKNNEVEVQQVFNEHNFMVLKEEHFAARQINWDDKITNMQRLAAELDLGLDSFVFLDDDPLNRAMVRQALSDVEVIELPADPARYLTTVAKRHDFGSLQFTGEDSRRGAIYAEQRRRRELRAVTPDITKYLRQLKMRVTLEEVGDMTIPRIAQLTQKTNQFNMTTRRYQEEEIRRLAVDDKYLVVAVGVKDTFGDNGLTGLAIVERLGEIWRIDTFLLSCRIIGRRVEDVLLAYLVGRALAAGGRTVVGEFIESERNEVVRGFYKRCGFKMTEKRDGVEKWELAVRKGYPYPDFIRINENHEQA